MKEYKRVEKWCLPLNSVLNRLLLSGLHFTFTFLIFIATCRPCDEVLVAQNVMDGPISAFLSTSPARSNFSLLLLQKLNIHLALCALLQPSLSISLFLLSISFLLFSPSPHPKYMWRFSNSISLKALSPACHCGFISSLIPTSPPLSLTATCFDGSPGAEKKRAPVNVCARLLVVEWVWDGIFVTFVR